MTLPADMGVRARRDPIDVAARYAAPLFLVLLIAGLRGAGAAVPASA